MALTFIPGPGQLGQLADIPPNDHHTAEEIPTEFIFCVFLGC